MLRPATMRSAAEPSRTLREAIQPTPMNAAYMATTAAMAGVTGLRIGDNRAHASMAFRGRCRRTRMDHARRAAARAAERFDPPGRIARGPLLPGRRRDARPADGHRRESCRGGLHPF